MSQGRNSRSDTTSRDSFTLHWQLWLHVLLWLFSNFCQINVFAMHTYLSAYEPKLYLEDIKLPNSTCNRRSITLYQDYSQTIFDLWKNSELNVNL
jgi:hypothetical protein